jgi:hypothetical protein
MLVISTPCAFLVVVVEGASMLCFVLINFIGDGEIDGLAADLVSGIFAAANNLSLQTTHLHIIFLPSS